MLLVLFFIWLFSRFFRLIGKPNVWRRKKLIRFSDTRVYRNRKKEDWVIKAVVRLAALMPNFGCRKIAETFNRIHVGKESVGKTFVSVTLKAHWYEVLRIRKRYKHRIPRPMKPNLIWGMDLTFVTDESGTTHPVLGIVDHGSRAALWLKRLENKSSATILRALADVIEVCGKPKAIRTDNEVCFCSRLIRLALRCLRIKHQKSDKGCPWMNGRIERLFLTFKQTLPRVINNGKSLNHHISLFPFWYNHVRPHQHLAGRTPAEVWSGKPANRKGLAFYGRQGKMQGFYLPPD